MQMTAASCSVLRPDVCSNVSIVVRWQEDDNNEQGSDVRAQLKFFEQLDLLEKQRKEEQEREILLKAAKVLRHERQTSELSIHGQKVTPFW